MNVLLELVVHVNLMVVATFLDCVNSPDVCEIIVN